jgi:hypothetical protein
VFAVFYVRQRKDFFSCSGNRFIWAAYFTGTLEKNVHFALKKAKMYFHSCLELVCTGTEKTLEVRNEIFIPRKQCTTMNWFKQYGWLYIPVSTEGIIVTIFAIVLWYLYAAVVRNGHSVTDDLYKIFVYATCTAFWWKWVAEKTSSKKNEETITS